MIQVKNTEGVCGRSTLLAVAAILVFAAVARADLEEADRLRKEGKHAEAVEAYGKVLAGDESNHAALFGRAFSLTELGRGEMVTDSLWGARRHMEKLVALVPGNPDYHFLNGRSAHLLALRAPSYASSLLDLCEGEFTTCTKLRPDWWDAWFHLGKALRDKGKAERAVEAFGNAIILWPDRLEPYPMLALTEYSLKRYDDCIRTTKTLMGKCPTYHYGHKIIGDALTAKSDFAAAEAEYLLGLAADSANTVWTDSLWLLFQRSKDHGRAVEVFSSLLEKRPESEACRKFLALTYTTLKRFEEAAVEYRELARRFPSQPWYFQWLGETEEYLKNEEAAVAAYLGALRLRSDWTNPYLPLKGRFERDMKAERFAEAAALLKRISACNPNAEVHAWVLWFLSKCTIQLGEVEETIRALKKTVELIPDVARFNNSLGLLYRTLGRMDEAEAEFKKALEKEPGYIYSIENLGGMSQIIGQGREARKWFENGLAEAQEQYKWAGDIEMKSERGFDVFKFSYFLHEIETVEGEEKK